MNIISKYIGRIFLQYLGTTLFALLLLVVISQLFGSIGEVFNDPKKLLGFLDTLVRSLPTLVNMLLPMTVLLATVFTFNNLGRSSELVALKSLGFSYFRCLRPVLALMILIASIAYFNQNYLHRWLNSSEIEGKALQINNQWLADAEAYYFFSRTYTNDKTAQGINVYLSESDPFRLSAIKSIPLLYWNNDENWLMESSIQRKLKSGNWNIQSQGTEELPIQAIPDPFLLPGIDVHHLPIFDLMTRIRQLEIIGHPVSEFQVELQQKFAALLAPFALAIFGAPLAQSHFRKGGASLDVMICILGGLVFLIATEIMFSLGKGGYIPPIPATWSINILFGTLGLLLGLRKQ